MLKDEEDRLKTQRQASSSHHDNASSPQILLASSTPSYNNNSASRTQSSDQQYHQNHGNRSNRGRGVEIQGVAVTLIGHKEIGIMGFPHHGPGLIKHRGFLLHNGQCKLSGPTPPTGP